jgi:hypothetical protein
MCRSDEGLHTTEDGGIGDRGAAVAVCGARTTAGARAADRRADGICRERPRRTGPCRGVPRGTPDARAAASGDRSSYARSYRTVALEQQTRAAIQSTLRSFGLGQ